MNSLSLILSLFFISTVYGANTLVQLSSTCLSSINTAYLNAHNTYRASHGAAALKQNVTINAIAQNYANYLAINGLFQHSGAKGLGENLAYTYSSSAPNLNNCGAYASTFVKMWYDEIKDYNFNSPGFTSATGHFTQVVWKSSTQLGCAVAITTGNRAYGVCNYSPPGNYLNQFAANVAPLSG